MNEEELKALVDELKAEKESLANKNKELLSEVKKERNKSREIDADKYYAMIDEVESVKAENAKLVGEVKLKAKDFEKLTLQIGERDASLSKLLIEDGITNELVKLNVPAHYMDAVKALHRGSATLKDNQAFLGDKPLSEALNEWATSDAGKPFIKAPANSGGGAGGSKGGDNGSNIDISKMTPNEMMRAGREKTT